MKGESEMPSSKLEEKFEKSRYTFTDRGSMKLDLVLEKKVRV